MKRTKIVSILVICFTFLFLLVGCGCGKIHYKTYNDIKTELNTVYVEGTDEVSIKARKEKYFSVAKTDVLNIFDEYKHSYINDVKITEDNNTTVINKINEIKNTLNTDMANLEASATDEFSFATSAANVLKQALENLKSAAGSYLESNPTNDKVTLSESEYRDKNVLKIEKSSLLLYLNNQALASTLNVVKDDKYKDYQIMRFREDRDATTAKLAEINTIILPSDVTSEKSYDDVLTERANEIFKIMENLALKIQEHVTEPEPIRWQLKNFGQFFTNFFDNFFVYPIGILLLFFSKLCGGYYIFGLIITTLIIRTVGWPIYTKTNDMSLKMKLMEPEQAKIQEKYARRKDEESQRMMQMELMQLYKKYKIGLGGCFMPFLQFPIFLAVFQAISRFPYTNGFAGSPDWVSSIKSSIFGLDLFQDKSAGTGQLIGIIILCVLVVGTQLLQQWLMNRKQKQQQEQAQADVPAYRRQAVNQQGGMATQMKIMTLIMTGMMGVFVITSKAGLGVYWLIGNIYAMVQQVINSANSSKRLEKLREKHNR